MIISIHARLPLAIHIYIYIREINKNKAWRLIIVMTVAGLYDGRGSLVHHKTEILLKEKCVFN